MIKNKTFKNKIGKAIYREKQATSLITLQDNKDKKWPLSAT